MLVLSMMVCTCLARGQDARSPGTILNGNRLKDSVEVSAMALREFPLPAWHSMITDVPAAWYGAYRSVFQPMKVSSIVGLGMLTVALVTTDEETYRLTRRFHDASQFNRSFTDVCVYMGDGLPHFGAAAGLALFGFATGDRRAVRTSSELVEALIGTAFVVHVVKRTTGRERPSRATRPGGVWDIFPNQGQYDHSVSRFDAFPSGHLSTTVATLTVIMESYPEATWLKPVSYSVIGLVAFGLVNKGMHWYSDFPVAIALGHLIGTAAVHLNRADPAGGQNGSALVVTPVSSGGHAGVAVEYDF
jgi:membrane-associated phospholipid phosphatase